MSPVLILTHALQKNREIDFSPSIPPELSVESGKKLNHQTFMSTAYISAELECLRHIQKLFAVHTLVIAHTPPPPHCCYGSTLFFAFSSTLCWCNRVAGKNRLVLLWLCLIASCVSMCTGTIYMFDCSHLVCIVAINKIFHACSVPVLHTLFILFGFPRRPRRRILCISSLMKAPHPHSIPTGVGVSHSGLWGQG